MSRIAVILLFASFAFAQGTTPSTKPAEAPKQSADCCAKMKDGKAAGCCGASATGEKAGCCGTGRSGDGASRKSDGSSEGMMCSRKEHSEKKDEAKPATK